MRHMRRIGAVTGVAALLKAGQALGLASSVSRASASPAPDCGTNAFVKFQTPMVWDGDSGTSHLPQYGTVFLWYSATCRSVAAEVSVPDPVPPFQPATAAMLHKENGSWDNDAPPAYCAVGSRGCKTGFFDDAGIRQAAGGATWRAGGDGYGNITAFW